MSAKFGKARVYVCHTYYHVYVTFLKELKRKSEGEREKRISFSLRCPRILRT